MKAAAYDRNGGPEVFRYTDVPDPAVRPGGLVIEIKAIGIQGGDLINRREGKLVTRDDLVVGRSVRARRRVCLRGAGPAKDLVVMRGHVPRVLEQVLEQVREARARRRLVGATDAIPDTDTRLR